MYGEVCICFFELILKLYSLIPCSLIQDNIFDKGLYPETNQPEYGYK